MIVAMKIRGIEMQTFFYLTFLLVWKYKESIKNR